VVMLLSLTAACVSALCALVSYRASKAAKNRASTTSLRAELDEIRDAFEKNSALLKRIHQRTVMQERRQEVREEQTGVAGSLKDRLRRQVGLTPGKPYNHGG
jgi:hypothetical protein